jgi:hypothetical protein
MRAPVLPRMKRVVPNRVLPRHGSFLFISFFPFCPLCYFFIDLSLIL